MPPAGENDRNPKRKRGRKWFPRLRFGLRWIRTVSPVDSIIRRNVHRTSTFCGLMLHGSCSASSESWHGSNRGNTLAAENCRKRPSKSPFAPRKQRDFRGAKGDIVTQNAGELNHAGIMACHLFLSIRVVIIQQITNPAGGRPCPGLCYSVRPRSAAWRFSPWFRATASAAARWEPTRPGARETPAAGGTCNENICGPKQGEVLKGENELTAERRAMAEEAHARTVQRHPPQGDRAAFSGEYWDCHTRRRLSLRLLRHAAVQFRDQVRLRHRLAEFLEAHRRQGRGRSDRQEPRHAAGGGRLQQVPGPPGPRLRRRPQADRPALLHQFGFLEARRAEAGRGNRRTTRPPLREDGNRDFCRRLFLGRRGDLPPDRGREGDRRRLYGRKHGPSDLRERLHRSHRPCRGRAGGVRPGGRFLTSNF